MVKGRLMTGIELFEGIDGLEVLTDEPMSYHTSFRIGGPANYFLIPKNIDSLMSLIKRLSFEEIKPFIFGAGTNLLVGDGGIRGVVVNMLGIVDNIVINDDSVKLPSGSLIINSVKKLSEKGIRCLQWAYGIPGTVGGAVHMNAGAFGSDISEWLSEIEIITQQGELRRVSRGDLQFEYRRSDIQKYGIVVSVSFRYEKEEPKLLLGEIDDYIKIRESRHPLDYPNAGSIFKNPSKAMPAGKLIEEAGLKGLRVGDALISKKHANFIINIGNASAKDVIELIRRVQDEVLHRFDVFLEPEITMIGE
ncbi:MAG: UDP-N-acetylmuramate dehydrogenase [bacterium]